MNSSRRATSAFRDTWIVFGSLTALFFLLAAAEAAGSVSLAKLAGWVGLFCGASAVYAGLAQVLNEVYGKTVWPLGTVPRN